MSILNCCIIYDNARNVVDEKTCVSDERTVVADKTVRIFVASPRSKQLASLEALSTLAAQTGACFVARLLDLCRHQDLRRTGDCATHCAPKRAEDEPLAVAEDAGGGARGPLGPRC